MKPETSSAKLWLLRVWLYGVPIIFTTPLIVLGWISDFSSSLNRWIFCLLLFASMISMLRQGRIHEMADGANAWPNRDHLGKFLVFLAILTIILVMSIHHSERLWLGAAFCVLISGTPSQRSFEKQAAK